MRRDELEHGRLVARLPGTGAETVSMAFSPAGDALATSTFGESPGVTMSWSEMCTWNDDTPATVPAGARISAG